MEAEPSGSKNWIEPFSGWLEKLAGSGNQTGQARWNMFVEQTFMNPFVQQEGKNFGRPWELWKGHFTGNVFPEKEGEFEQFFKNAKVRILKRGGDHTGQRN